MAAEQKRIGELVLSRRRALGLTHEDLAREAGVSISTVQRAETGATEQMRKQTRRALGQALKVDPDLLRPAPPAPDLLGQMGDGDGAKGLVELREEVAGVRADLAELRRAMGLDGSKAGLEQVENAAKLLTTLAERLRKAG